jgi:hypothetical protein
MINNVTRMVVGFYKRVKSTVLLTLLMIMIIMRGRGFNIGKIYDESIGFIRKSVREEITSLSSWDTYS